MMPGAMAAILEPSGKTAWGKQSKQQGPGAFDGVKLASPEAFIS